MNRGGVLIVLLIAVFCWTCKPDFIEIDLSKSVVTLISPTDTLHTTTLTQTFWWSEVEGATGYEIQIISPTIANPTTLVLDSLTVYDQYTVTLTPGSYEWQVRAYNNSSTTNFTIFSLTIDSTPDIASQIIVLTSPANNLVTNQMAITFRWETLYNADDYRIEIAYPDFNGTLELNPQSVQEDSFPHDFTQEGEFQWRVRGQNAFSNTGYTTYAIEIDTTAPITPILLSPANNDTIPDTVATSFSWDRGAVSGSTIMDSLFLYADTGMVTLLNSFYTSNPSFTDTLVSDVYFWRVRSFDAATNKSGYSVLRKLTVQ